MVNTNQHAKYLGQKSSS